MTTSSRADVVIRPYTPLRQFPQGATPARGKKSLPTV